jgi:hypothetical protein
MKNKKNNPIKYLLGIATQAITRAKQGGLANPQGPQKAHLA